MQFRAKLAIGGVLVVGIVVTLMVVRAPEQPIQVVGNLSKQDVAAIRKAVWKKTHPPILTDLSTKSFLAAPHKLVTLFARTPTIFKMEVRNQVFVAVLARPPSEAQPSYYVFWCVFKEKNGWRADDEYHLNNY
jgi:hypothetical protein